MSDAAGKLIVVDGGDGFGKTTQSTMLLDALQQSGTASFFDFPRYGTSVYADVIAQYLRGEFGAYKDITPYLSSLPYTLDRVGASKDIRAALEKGHVVCNRYVPSNIAYQAAKLPEEKREEFIRFIEHGEYEELAVPKPDAVLYLNVDTARAAELIDEKGMRDYMNNEHRKDEHEKDLAFQTAVAQIYLELATARDDWYVIECMGERALKSKEEIHASVMQVVEPLLR